jgi:hypothetical protein
MEKLKKISQLVLGFVTMVSLTSCATIVSGSHQAIGIASNPGDACVWVDRVIAGKTPLIVEMSRKNNHIVRIELEGYEPYEVVMTRKLNGWVFGNLVFGGVVGIALDVASGAIYKLTPDQLYAEIRCNEMMYSRTSKRSYIFVVLEPKASWEKIGNLAAVN